LKIETEILDDHQAKITVEIDADKMEGMKKRAARNIARRIKVPGFRPGKAPFQVILRQVGEAAVLEEAIDILVDDIYPKIIEEAEIKPYGPGSLQNIPSMEPPTLEFLVPLEAEVILGEYKSISKPYEPEDVTDDDVDRVLKNLQEQQAIIEPVERAAEEGDVITVNIGANRAEIEEDEEPELMPGRSIPVVIAEENNEEESKEWPFPGFSRNLIGMSVDDDGNASYTFPEDSESELFQGKSADFYWKIESVKSRDLPELDDEFAESLGEYENMEALREEILSTLKEQNIQSYNRNYDDEIIKEVIEQSEIKYPPQMLEQELNSVMENFENNLRQQGMDMKLYLKTRDMKIEELRDEAKPVAKDQLKQSLVLLEISKVEEFTLDQSAIAAEAKSTMDYLTQSLSSKDARKVDERNLYSSLIGNIMADRLMKRSIEHLRNIGSGKLEEIEETSDSVDEEVEASQLEEKEIELVSEQIEADESALNEKSETDKIPEAVVEEKPAEDQEIEKAVAPVDSPVDEQAPEQED